MKRGIAITLVLLVFTGVGFGQDWNPGKYMKQAMDRILQNAAIMSAASDNMGYMPGVSIMGTFLDEGEEVGWSASFDAGTDYILLGAGDEDATDVDITIYDAKGNQVMADTETDAIPLVFFTPEKSGQYSIKLKLYEASVSSFCTMVLLQEGGKQIDFDNLNQVSNTAIAIGEETNKSFNISFNDESNQWALYGAALSDSEEVTVTNVHLAEGINAMIGSGDSNCNDADLALYDSAGNELTSDTETDNVPVLVHDHSGSGTYQLKIKNYDSSGPSLIIVMLVEG